MKLKDISRTATFAWDQTSSSSPLLVTGAVAGALDESFSNESQLEIWRPDFGGEGVGALRLGGEGQRGPEGSITVGSRFNRLAWSSPNASHAQGVIAAGMETGEINVYDPAKILAGADADAARIFRSDKHAGPVRGLDFNPIQKNLLLSGGINAELFIFDLNNPSSAPIPPGPASTKLGEITSLQWNPTVSRVFAASSSSGYTSVWDLKAGKEIVSLQYGGGAAKGGAVAGMAGLQVGARRGMSDPTRLITASEDDDSPIIMLWDLRNTRAPEKILSGHTKGVLSVAWCKQDADLLLSCGKDNRTLCWNPQTGEIVGELPSSSDWSFQTTWCPRNPDLLATASFDGHIGIHSLQTTQAPAAPTSKLSETATADDIFGALGDTDQVDDTANVLSLIQPPKWLRRPVSATFGYGGLLASTSNLTGATGKHQSGVAHLRKITTEPEIIERAEKLHAADGQKEQLESFCDGRASDKGDAAWKALQTLFKANSRDELVQLLGFSKEEVKKQVEEAIKKLPGGGVQAEATEPEADVEEESNLSTPKNETANATPSETSEAAPSGGAELTEKSLFDQLAADSGSADADGSDFFSSIASGSLRNPRLDSISTPKNEIAESSRAATVGSRPSSVRSESIKDNTFHIYPSGENDTDRLITQALVLGNFASAVDLCLASERYADALLLAVRGGPDLLQSTQKAYFAKRTTTTPFLRVFQSIVTEDLVDIVQNADLGEWRVAFVVLCTFAKDAEFNNLADQLGQRLQYKSTTLSSSDTAAAKEARQDATLCYLAARKLEKVVSIWSEEMREEESSSESSKDTTRYTAHALALQSFIEKVAVFTAATGYVDQDLMSPTQSTETAEAGARTYKLASLYNRYYEYADLLAAQGMVDIAAKYVKQTPADYRGASGSLDKARDRLFAAAGISSGSAQATQPAGPYGVPPAANLPPMPTQAPPASYQPNQSSFQPSFPQPPQQQQNNFTYNAPYQPSQQPQQQPQQQQQQPYQAAPSPYAPNGYGGPSQQQGQTGGYGLPNQQQQQYGAPPQAQPLGPPPRSNLINGTGANGTPPPPLPAAQRRDIPGWNDAPALSSAPKRPQSAAKVAPIMSPFPISDQQQQQYMQQPGQGNGQGPPPMGITPPPNRAAPGMLPPPPKGGPRPPSAQAQQQQQYQQPPPSAPPLNRTPTAGPPPPQRGSTPRAGPPPPGLSAGPPPPRALSPLGPGRGQQGQQGQYVQPSIAGQLRPTSAQGQQQAQQQAGPPPPGRAGPPPPNRAGSAMSVSQGAPQVRSPPSQSSPVMPPPPQAKALHPQGDRSHIPQEARGIYETLNEEMNRVKGANLPAPLQKIVADTERRLNIFFDALNNETVPKDAVQKMGQISAAIAARDLNGALALHVDMLTGATGEMTSWAPGVKQLIRLGV
ncbi:uncharacterized protein MKK02DRAFT_25129 [Dioszegia hungarica]|uniref:Protein transport protein SEC31 n=1 Tax=Dioszegia hungarica TaxID=4972 RepID=A0AA38HAZ7_9TREE|nr:uncharacterized protein MKK02DRAFT_25129 [Dioszegia hungarica]KAI9636109.1 hypothetical protein MKK02DRAFT_25129 [Dioszegia hungarica]